MTRADSASNINDLLENPISRTCARYIMQFVEIGYLQNVYNYSLFGDIGNPLIFVWAHIWRLLVNI